MAKRSSVTKGITDASTGRYSSTAPAERGMFVHEERLESTAGQLAPDGELPAQDAEVRQAQPLAERMDRLRREIGPIGVRVCELIEAGRDGGWGPGIRRGYPPLDLARREMCYRPRRALVGA